MCNKETPPVKTKATAVSKPRLDCIDGCRFALVLPICVAHFARFGFHGRRVLQVLTQENVLVGGFFIISGYVAAYTSTKVGEKSVEEKALAAPELFFWRKVMSYFPLHAVTSTVFAPMFLAVERWYGTPWHTSALRAVLNYTMLQAWFPKEAEIWNQPTWFLSALTFSNLTMPTILRAVARLSKNGLRKLFAALTAVSVLQKLSYSDTSHFRSRCTPRAWCHPLIWNMTRFHPFSALAEVAMGIVAARSVMLDMDEDRRDHKASPLLYFVAAHGSLLLRLTRFDYNDAIIRGTLFVPLYTRFLMAMHRECAAGRQSLITRFFGSESMKYLGSLSFPMFILHGPIGQIFYKKVVAKRLWGGPLPKAFFPLYLFVVLLCSHCVNEGFVKSKKVQRWSGLMSTWLATHTEGMLRDTA